MANSKTKRGTPHKTTADGNFDRQSETAESGHDIRIHIAVQENDLSISKLGGDKIFSPVQVR
jgi:hypothetical protein